MNANEIRTAAKEATINTLAPALKNIQAIRFSDNQWAVRQEVDGQEVWVEISIKTKNFKDTKVSPAFDPYTEIQKWYKGEKE